MSLMSRMQHNPLGDLEGGVEPHQTAAGRPLPPPPPACEGEDDAKPDVANGGKKQKLGKGKKDKGVDGEPSAGGSGKRTAKEKPKVPRVQ